MPGDLYLLAGRYRLIERLGQGGAGTVWRAIDEMLDRQVAVKQVRIPEGLDPRERAEFADRAMHEARSAGRLRDPAIVLVHDVVLDGGRPWIIMDLTTGRSLDKVIKERGPLPPGFVAAVGLRVLSALEVAHAHSLLHQDVKPANILLDADGTAMLTDFGIAAPMGGRGDMFGSAGSPGYMAPERLNEQPSGPSADLWSLGASLYTAVEGRAPFERALPAAVAAAVLLHEPPFPTRAGHELGRLLMAMLAKDPAARPTAAQVRQALSGLAGQGAAPRPAERRRRWWLLPGVLAAVVALGAGGWYAAAALGEQETGRYATAPDPCALLTDAQAAELVRGSPERSLTRPGECRWLIREGMYPARSLLVRVWAEQPTADLDGPRVAQRRFDSERSTRAAAEGVTRRQAYGKIREITGVGEVAIAQNGFRFYENSNESGIADSILLFRTSNLLGEVIWHREDVDVDTAPGGEPAGAITDQKTAVAAARLIMAALAK
ncbi:serine/threonine-protein kinase [Nonomuraea gerenzanensis]|uniref:non-specific serine/threonine protein kinase n=1 Tax=Nonomuraea gerenzanensis TaxID=93944 RepID=A0A1M4E6P8_9ACTN|nr:serine/threonine-protein kinase [Nonomuraea gerenzanensis]UBU16763.1 serine/threonine protein kinase [Nonomuraea gerenzanensis]SBO94472.1 serine/threonine protein kinase [Nonomuraea gerenzanensis]